jgi:hypothetical protein
MEIHAPHHPIMSLREFLVHLAMVTLGILIALGLEQSVEAYHHAHLAQEAHDNMMTEIRENKKELDEHLAKLAEAKKEREDDLEVIDQLLAHKPLKELHMSLNFSGATLNSASWTTAATVGATAFMEYADVKRFAEVYKKQEFFDRLQDEQVKSVQEGLGMMSSLNGPKTADDDLRAMKRQMLQSHAAVIVLQQLGQQLDASYDKILHK